MSGLDLVLLFITISFQLLCDGKVMMEYIGATGIPVKFDDVPIKTGMYFHFILSFAIDANSSGSPQNGVGPHPYTGGGGCHQSPPSQRESHGRPLGLEPGRKTPLLVQSTGQKPMDIERVFIIKIHRPKLYHLDGIDVDYERFPKHSNDSFAYCIGELITLLKNQSLISTATIAPFHTTVLPYIELYERYEDVIDYVNYQFYTDKLKTPEKYLEAFKNRTQQFDRDKVLPSYEVNGRGIQGDAFFAALKLLEDNGFYVNGAMIFSADASASSGYYYETRAQEFLLHNSTK